MTGAAASQPSVPVPQSPVITAAGITLTAPKNWIREAPSAAGMNRVAQFKISGAAGDGEVVVYHFGQGQGGTVDGNTKRWQSQFTNPDKPDAPPEPETSTLEQDGLKITNLTLHGTYKPGMVGMPGGSSEPRPNYMLHGIIIESGPEGSVFVRITGPEATLKPQGDALEKFARSARKADPGPLR